MTDSSAMMGSPFVGADPKSLFKRFSREEDEAPPLAIGAKLEADRSDRAANVIIVAVREVAFIFSMGLLNGMTPVMDSDAIVQIMKPRQVPWFSSWRNNTSQDQISVESDKSNHRPSSIDDDVVRSSFIFFSEQQQYPSPLTMKITVSLLCFFHSLMGFALASDEPDESCTCMLLDRPDVLEKEKRARWMVHSLNYGVLSTISTRLPGSPPFGNVYSFVDGDCSSSSGVPYFYGTYMDQSFEDVKLNPSVSFTLSEASLPSVCSASPLKACTADNGRGDPELPVCARLTMYVLL